MSEDNKKGTFETWTEELSVAGNDLIDTLKELLNDASVHRLLVINKRTDKVVVDIPALYGVPAAIFLNIWMVLGALVLYATDFKVVIERRLSTESDADGAGDKTAEDSAETTEPQAEPAQQSAAEPDAPVEPKSADKAEAKSEAKPEAKSDAPAAKEDKASTKEREKAADDDKKIDPTHCQGMTKAGKQCKRKPMEGSAYCFAHQPS